VSAHYGIPYCLHTQHNVSSHWMYQYSFYLDWWWLNEPKHVTDFLILNTNMCCVYWLNNLLNLLLFGNRVFSTVFTCSGNTGFICCIRIFELVNARSSESLLALQLVLLLCLLFLCFRWVLFCVLLVITACTVSQVSLVAVLTKGHWADKGIRL